MPPEAATVRALVAQWFARNARDLPWRDAGRTPWGVLVSEVMLQQTPVARVEPRWRAWMATWPTPAALASASTAEVLRAWDRLGYPRRALRLQDCARAIVAEHGGQVPRTEPELLALPGVGVYTAAAVMAFAHGTRSVVVDTNVRRVLARVFEGVALPAPNVTAASVRLAEQVAPGDDAESALWAAGSMELGALVCTARDPRCELCPLARLCAWRLAGYPADEHAARRRSQKWAGTDRQARGTVMAALRAATGSVPRGELDQGWPDGAQLARALAGLIEDGLIEQTADGYRLPA